MVEETLARAFSSMPTVIPKFAVSYAVPKLLPVSAGSLMYRLPKPLSSLLVIDILSPRTLISMFAGMAELGVIFVLFFMKKKTERRDPGESGVPLVSGAGTPEYDQPSYSGRSCMTDHEIGEALPVLTKVPSAAQL